VLLVSRSSGGVILRGNPGVRPQEFRGLSLGGDLGLSSHRGARMLNLSREGVYPRKNHLETAVVKKSYAKTSSLSLQI